MTTYSTPSTSMTGGKNHNKPRRKPLLDLLMNLYSHPFLYIAPDEDILEHLRCYYELMLWSPRHSRSNTTIPIYMDWGMYPISLIYDFLSLRSSAFILFENYKSCRISYRLVNKSTGILKNPFMFEVYEIRKRFPTSWVEGIRKIDIQSPPKLPGFDMNLGSTIGRRSPFDLDLNMIG